MDNHQNRRPDPAMRRRPNRVEAIRLARICVTNFAETTAVGATVFLLDGDLSATNVRERSSCWPPTARNAFSAAAVAAALAENPGALGMTRHEPRAKAGRRAITARNRSSGRSRRDKRLRSVRCRVRRAHAVFYLPLPRRQILNSLLRLSQCLWRQSAPGWNPVGGEDPRTRDDREWFASHPTRRRRLRAPLLGELTMMRAFCPRPEWPAPFFAEVRQRNLRIAIATCQLFVVKRQRRLCAVPSADPLDSFIDAGICRMLPGLAASMDVPEEEFQRRYEAQTRARLQTVAEFWSAGDRADGHAL